MADWPDWSGQIAAVVASGQSARTSGLAALEGRSRVIAIKGTWELVPFCDAVYGCDYPWWRSVRGLNDFKGLRCAYADRAVQQYGCKKVGIAVQKDEILTDQKGLVGSGGNSGFQALNLAVQWGAKRIILVGFDYHGTHWYGRNTAQGMSNPTEHNFRRWISALTAARPKLEELGVEVVNASPTSACKAFPKTSVAEILDRWGV